MPDVRGADSDRRIFRCIPGKKIVFVRRIFVFGIRNFLPSRGFIISVNKFVVKILRLLAHFLY
jgi:hypothetical protein